MDSEKQTYVLRLHDDSSRDVLVPFNNARTARENLATLIKDIRKQGLLAGESPVDSFKLEHNGKTLNLDLPLSRQNVEKHDVLYLRDVISSIKLRIFLHPDKQDPIVETVKVNPGKPLKDEVNDALIAIREKYRFYGRQPRRFNLLNGKVKLDYHKSLRAQGIEDDIEVRLKPKVWFEWPPGFYWPPGPFTTYSIGLLLLIFSGLLVYRLLSGGESNFMHTVTIKSTQPCRLFDNKGNFWGEDKIDTTLAEGRYVVSVYPRDYPIYEQIIIISSDSLTGDSALVIVIDPKKRFADAKSVEVRISGFDSDLGSEVYFEKPVPLMINGYRHEYRGTGLSKRIDLVCGRYEIKFDLPENQLKKINVNGQRVERPDFIFDLTSREFENLKYIPISFWYSITVGEEVQK